MAAPPAVGALIKMADAGAGQGSTVLKFGPLGCKVLNREASWLSSPSVLSPLLRAASNDAP